MAERPNKLNKSVDCFVLDGIRTVDRLFLPTFPQKIAVLFIHMNLSKKLTVILPKY